MKEEVYLSALLSINTTSSELHEGMKDNLLNKGGLELFSFAQEVVQMLM